MFIAMEVKNYLKIFNFLKYKFNFQHPESFTVTDTKSSIKYAMLLYIIGIVHGFVSLCEMVVNTLIVCVTIDCNEEDGVTRIRKITNLEKIIIATFKK